MTTTTAMATRLMNDVETSLLPPFLFNIQYPNCRTGMFCLRKPFQDTITELSPANKRSPSTSNSPASPLQTSQLHNNQGY